MKSVRSARVGRIMGAWLWTIECIASRLVSRGKERKFVVMMMMMMTTRKVEEEVEQTWHRKPQEGQRGANL
jgi:hypothetical protein